MLSISGSVGSQTMPARGAKPGARVSVRANHYALLKTLEAGMGLSQLGHARGAATPTQG